MLIMRKEENWYGYYNVNIETDEGRFTIFYSKNGDLDWSIVSINIKPTEHIPTKYSFTITKENNYLYNAFERLYNAVKNGKPFSNNDFLDDENKNIEISNNKLFKNGKIQWHSDGFLYDEASILTIYKENDNFKVVFELSDNRNLFSTLSATICNSGSRYYPYNASFMNMYNSLLKYDYEKNQGQPVSVFETDDKILVKKL